MARKQLKESKMTSYLIKSKILDHVPDMIEAYEDEHNIKFSNDTKKELVAIGEEIIEAHFPIATYDFTIQKKDLKLFDEFIAGFVNGFMGLLVCAMRAHMHIAQVALKIDDLPDEAA